MSLKQQLLMVARRQEHKSNINKFLGFFKIIFHFFQISSTDMFLISYTHFVWNILPWLTIFPFPDTLEQNVFHIKKKNLY